ncbi:hypothetical protein [Alicyclobacillus hesperidum]|uniref:hypothetical protein n=1 Tax=Alicyclobacillus hesperidum TaxID=89784 RepID=UPI0015A17906|nr:hypothetical protein [Alicyclobacillus hesperidum]
MNRTEQVIEAEALLVDKDCKPYTESLNLSAAGAKVGRQGSVHGSLRIKPY